MFMQPTIDKLHALKLTGMADAVRKQLEDPGASQLSFEERLGLIIDHHWSWKENQALQRRLMNSKLRRDACIEDIDCWKPLKTKERGSNSVVECQLPVVSFIFYNLGALLSSLLSLRVLPEIVRFGWHIARTTRRAQFSLR